MCTRVCLSLSSCLPRACVCEYVPATLLPLPARCSFHAHAADERDVASFAFVNVFTGTHLLITYEKGSAVFKSDSPSTLFVLKQVRARVHSPPISRAPVCMQHVCRGQCACHRDLMFSGACAQILTAQATNVKVRVSTNVEIPTYACRHIMNMLHVKLSYLLSLRSKAELVDAVREMVTGESGDISFLHPFLQDILQNGDQYRKQLALLTRVLHMTSHIAEDAFVSYFKLRGRDVSDKRDALRALLLSYHEAREATVSFMESGGVAPPA